MFEWAPPHRIRCWPLAAPPQHVFCARPGTFSPSLRRHSKPVGRATCCANQRLDAFFRLFGAFSTARHALQVSATWPIQNQNAPNSKPCSPLPRKKMVHLRVASNRLPPKKSYLHAKIIFFFATTLLPKAKKKVRENGRRQSVANKRSERV